MVCGQSTTDAQKLSTSAPIVIQVKEISGYSKFLPRNRSELDAIVGKRDIGGIMVFLFIKDLKQHEAQELENYGRLLPNSVWIMDGSRLVAEASVVGTVGQDSSKEYGLLLWFDTVEDANSVGTVMRQGTYLEELIHNHKSDLDDPRGWILPNTRLGPMHIAPMFTTP